MCYGSNLISAFFPNQFNFFTPVILLILIISLKTGFSINCLKRAYKEFFLKILSW